MVQEEDRRRGRLARKQLKVIEREKKSELLHRCK